MYLLDAFPIEAGEINSDERVLPKLSGLSLVLLSLVLLISQTCIALIMLTHYDPRTYVFHYYNGFQMYGLYNSWLFLYCSIAKILQCV